MIIIDISSLDYGNMPAIIESVPCKEKYSWKVQMGYENLSSSEGLQRSVT